METNQTQEPSDYFKTGMEIFIAVVALVIALAAWRGSLAARAAGFEDYYALTATLKDVDTKTANTALAYQHYSVFTTYAANKTLAAALQEDYAKTTDADEKAWLALQMAQADKLAGASRSLFPARFINRQGEYDLKREIAEEYADAQRRADLDAETHLTRSSNLDLKTFGMAQMAILLSIALLNLTLASVLHPARWRVRWTGFLLGIFCLAISIVGMILTELG